MKTTKEQITLAIITKNRPQKLTRLLKSISELSMLPSQILIIDNYSQQTAEKTYQQWKSKLPVKYEYCLKTGAPHARNFALKNCQTRFLCFVDDDCVMKPDWLKVLLKELNQRQSGFVLGGSKLLNKDSYWARLQFQRYLRWVKHSTVSSTVLPLFFDTKNVCLDLKKIDRHQVRFDQIFSGLATAGGEDIDFGLQLSKLGIKGRYVPEMMVWHEEVGSFIGLIKKTYQKGKLEGFLYNKWQMCHLGEKEKKDFLSKIFFWGYKKANKMKK